MEGRCLLWFTGTQNSEEKDGFHVTELAQYQSTAAGHYLLARSWRCPCKWWLMSCPLLWSLLWLLGHMSVHMWWFLRGAKMLFSVKKALYQFFGFLVRADLIHSVRPFLRGLRHLRWRPGAGTWAHCPRRGLGAVGEEHCPRVRSWRAGWADCDCKAMRVNTTLIFVSRVDPCQF